MRKTYLITALLTMTCVMIAGQSASAFTLGRIGRDIGKTTKSAFLVEKDAALAPMAHVMFCQGNPDECRPRHRSRWGRAPIFMNAKRDAQLHAVNMMVNAQIRPRNDAPSQWGGDVWTLAPREGDCEDYAVTKRHQLIGMGWPERALRLAVTYTARGEGHMVLVARTSQGDLVLDNRIDKIRRWNKTGLKWKMLQAAINPRRWVQL